MKTRHSETHVSPATQADYVTGYRIELFRGQRSIVCLTCQRRSFHPTDIDRRYCGHCHVFHEDPR